MKNIKEKELLKVMLTLSLAIAKITSTVNKVKQTDPEVAVALKKSVIATIKEHTS